jgi:hypothetical protein
MNTKKRPMTISNPGRRVAVLRATTALAAALAITSAAVPARAAHDYLLELDGVVLSIPDEDGMTFSDLTVAVENGSEIVISGAVTITGTAGKPRSSNIIAVLIGFMDYTDDAFMDYTDDSCDAFMMTKEAKARACAAVSRAFRTHAAAQARSPAP